MAGQDEREHCRSRQKWNVWVLNAPPSRVRKPLYTFHVVEALLQYGAEKDYQDEVIRTAKTWNCGFCFLYYLVLRSRLDNISFTGHESKIE